MPPPPRLYTAVSVAKKRRTSAEGGSATNGHKMCPLQPETERCLPKSSATSPFRMIPLMIYERRSGASLRSFAPTTKPERTEP